MPHFIKVAKTYDIPPGEGATVEADGRYIAIFNADGAYYAISDTCLHMGASLGQGWLEGKMVTCPWHGWRFNVETGVSDFSGQVCIERYDVTVEGTDVYVRIGGR